MQKQNNVKLKSLHLRLSVCKNQECMHNIHSNYLDPRGHRNSWLEWKMVICRKILANPYSLLIRS